MRQHSTKFLNKFRKTWGKSWLPRVWLTWSTSGTPPCDRDLRSGTVAGRMRLFSVSDELARWVGVCVLMLDEDATETTGMASMAIDLEKSSPSSSSMLSLISPLSEPPPLTVDDATLPARAANGLQFQSFQSVEWQIPRIAKILTFNYN